MKHSALFALALVALVLVAHATDSIRVDISARGRAGRAVRTNSAVHGIDASTIREAANAVDMLGRGVRYVVDAVLRDGVVRADYDELIQAIECSQVDDGEGGLFSVVRLSLTDTHSVHTWAVGDKFAAGDKWNCTTVQRTVSVAPSSAPEDGAATEQLAMHETTVPFVLGRIEEISVDEASKTATLVLTPASFQEFFESTKISVAANRRHNTIDTHGGSDGQSATHQAEAITPTTRGWLSDAFSKAASVVSTTIDKAVTLGEKVVDVAVATGEAVQTMVMFATTGQADVSKQIPVTFDFNYDEKEDAAEDDSISLLEKAKEEEWIDEDALEDMDLTCKDCFAHAEGTVYLVVQAQDYKLKNVIAGLYNFDVKSNAALVMSINKEFKWSSGVRNLYTVTSIPSMFISVGGIPVYVSFRLPIDVELTADFKTTFSGQLQAAVAGKINQAVMTYTPEQGAQYVYDSSLKPTFPLGIGMSVAVNAGLSVMPTFSVIAQGVLTLNVTARLNATAHAGYAIGTESDPLDLGCDKMSKTSVSFRQSLAADVKFAASVGLRLAKVTYMAEKMLGKPHIIPLYGPRTTFQGCFDVATRQWTSIPVPPECDSSKDTACAKNAGDDEGEAVSNALSMRAVRMRAHASMPALAPRDGLAVQKLDTSDPSDPAFDLDKVLGRCQTVCRTSSSPLFGEVCPEISSSPVCVSSTHDVIADALVESALSSIKVAFSAAKALSPACADGVRQLLCRTTMPQCANDNTTLVVLTVSECEKIMSSCGVLASKAACSSASSLFSPIIDDADVAELEEAAGNEDDEDSAEDAQPTVPDDEEDDEQSAEGGDSAEDADSAEDQESAVPNAKHEMTTQRTPKRRRPISHGRGVARSVAHITTAAPRGKCVPLNAETAAQRLRFCRTATEAVATGGAFEFAMFGSLEAADAHVGQLLGVSEALASNASVPLTGCQSSQLAMLCAAFVPPCVGELMSAPEPACSASCVDTLSVCPPASLQGASTEAIRAAAQQMCTTDPVLAPFVAASESMQCRQMVLVAEVPEGFDNHAKAIGASFAVVGGIAVGVVALVVAAVVMRKRAIARRRIEAMRTELQLQLLRERENSSQTV